MKIRCGLYDRVSTELQAQFGLSVAAQKEDLYRYAREHGYEVAGFFMDEGITARKKMQNRKGFLQLMELVKQDKIDLILVTKLDRWFRNVRDYHNTLHRRRPAQDQYHAGRSAERMRPNQRTDQGRI